METQEKKFVPASKQIPTVNGGWLDRELGEQCPKPCALVSHMANKPK